MNSNKFWDDFISSTGFSHRANQDELVSLISDTLIENGYLLAQAGTGTGKSLASVVPALNHTASRAKDSGPVVISTATKALQGQYANKDLPFMAMHWKHPDKQKAATRPPEAGFTHAVLKGKRNYLCREKLHQPSAPIPKEMLKKLSNLPPSHDGDVASLGLTKQQEMALTTTADDCPGARECVYAAKKSDGTGGCYYENAKDKATASEVMVVNHALLAMHVKIFEATEGNICLLPDPGVIVLDECHKFPAYMQNALGWQLTRSRLLRWANECLEKEDEREEFKKEVTALFKGIEFDKEDKKRQQQIVERNSLKENKHVHKLVGIVGSAVRDWEDEAAASHETDDYKKLRKAANLYADLQVMVLPDEGDNFWVEMDKSDNKVLNYRPSEEKTADYLNKNMWPIAPSILLSATTPSPNVLGLPESHDTFEADSPFDFWNQSRLFISNLDGSPPFGDHLKRQMWEKARYDQMFKLVAASDGRALLLFTSWMDLNNAYSALEPKLRGKVTVLKQDRDNESERDKLARLFKEDEHSVLFGTESFFEGIDIPGKSLQLVVISKLPFPAMEDATRGGKLDFTKQMLPEMRMKLVQAAGRLIRSKDDHGLVAMLDARFATKPYGKRILRNVSPFNEMQQVDTLEDAMDYLESLEDE